MVVLAGALWSRNLNTYPEYLHLGRMNCCISRYVRVPCNPLLPNGCLVSSVGGTRLGLVLAPVVGRLACDCGSGWVRLGEREAMPQSLSEEGSGPPVCTAFLCCLDLRQPNAGYSISIL